MEKIVGKTIVFTDIHCGLSSNKESRLKICANVVISMLKYIKQHNVKNLIFMGDWFHERAAINSNTINVAYQLMESLAKKCRCIIILGNHDLYLKNSTDITSVNMFRHIQNVEIISNVEEVELNSQRALLVPWLGDLSHYETESVDLMFGHFDISSKYLIKSYVEDNKTTVEASSKILQKIKMSDAMKSAIEYSSESSKLIGNFVDICCKNGVVFAGHIHKRKEMIVKGRNFIFVGSPYQQTLGDIGDSCGFYVLDEQNSYKFIEVTNVPVHVQLNVSNILKIGIENFDFSIVKGNIVQKIYDVDISVVDDAKINHKISDFQPYEELLPDYQVKLNFEANDAKTDTMIESIKKSKLDYIKNYIDQIDDDVIAKNKLDKTKLFELMKQYYEKVAE